jgi:DNA-binding CsgD family transcriptional regulator
MDNHLISSNQLLIKVSTLMEYIMQSKSRAQVLAYLRTFLDPCGAPVDVVVAKLDEAGQINTGESITNTSIEVVSESTSILSNSPLAIALRESRTFFEGFRSENSNLRINTEKSLNASRNNKNVYIPTSMTRVYRFSFHCQSEVPEVFFCYLEYIRSILTQWERLKADSGNLNPPKRDFLGSALTERQEKVLQHLKRGCTNSHIAVLLGFSESLIRQETIVIYRKLGVRGRRDIFESELRGLEMASN